MVGDYPKKYYWIGLGIILIGFTSMLYSVSMKTHTFLDKKKPCVVIISVEDLCKEVEKNG